jgi:hypothetical protein
MQQQIEEYNIGYRNNIFLYNIPRNTYYDKYWTFKIKLQTIKITRKFIVFLFLINNRNKLVLPPEMVFHILSFFQLKDFRIKN